MESVELGVNEVESALAEYVRKVEVAASVLVE